MITARGKQVLHVTGCGFVFVLYVCLLDGAALRCKMNFSVN